MKDPKVEQLVSELETILKQLNTVTEQLKLEGVRFALDRRTVNDLFTLRDVHQLVRYYENV